MKILVERRWKKATYTIGRLSVDGVYFCNTCEDTDRGLTQGMELADIRERKVYGETAIPRGTYRVTLAVRSPKYSAVAWYRNLTGGYMPRLVDVPGFDGILVHPGSSALDSIGCLLVGRNTIKGGLTSSRATFAALYKRMKEADGRGENITIEIR